MIAKSRKRGLAARIERGLLQALAFARGTADESQVRVHIPPEIDTRSIRAKLGMTQEQFAHAFGFDLETLRHWEHGRRVPDASAQTCLMAIGRTGLSARRPKTPR